MNNKLKRFLIPFALLMLMLGSPSFVFAATSESGDELIDKVVEDSDLNVNHEIEPRNPVIAIAIRALLSLGRTELARYLADKGTNAYCSNYGDSGPGFISDLICD